jgi:hypothetical protein
MIVLIYQALMHTLQELQRILSRCLDIIGTANGSSMMQSEMDYLVVIRSMESQLIDWDQAVTNRTSIPYVAEWHRTGAAGMDEQFQYGVIIEKFYFNYAMLVINSFGLQNAMDRATINLGHFFTKCHTHATKCAMYVKDELASRGYMRYSPDSHFVLSSYAVLSLLKVWVQGKLRDTLLTFS